MFSLPGPVRVNSVNKGEKELLPAALWTDLFLFSKQSPDLDTFSHLISPSSASGVISKCNLVQCLLTLKRYCASSARSLLAASGFLCQTMNLTVQVNHKLMIRRKKYH